MTIALVAAIFSIIGVVVGHALNSGAEYHRWLRQERYARCAQLLAMAEEIRTRKLIHQIFEEEFTSGITVERMVAIAKAYGFSASDDELNRLAESALNPEDWGIDDGPAYVKRLLHDMERVSVAVSAIELISTTPVAEAAQELESALLRVGSLGDDRGDVRYTEARKALVAAAQAEIGPIGLLGSLVNRDNGLAGRKASPVPAPQAPPAP